MNKKLLILLGAYASWVVATLLYNKKNPSEIKSELDSARNAWEKDCKVLFNNFIEIHKNLLEGLKARLLTEENKNLFHQKKDEFLQLSEEYRKKGQEIFEEYKLKGQDYTQEWLEKLEEFYQEKLKDLDTIKENAPDKIHQTKKKLIAYFEDFKERLIK